MPEPESQVNPRIKDVVAQANTVNTILETASDWLETNVVLSRKPMSGLYDLAGSIL